MRVFSIFAAVFFLIGESSVCSKSVPSTAVWDKKAFEEDLIRARNTIIFEDVGDILTWNCSQKSNDDFTGERYGPQAKSAGEVIGVPPGSGANVEGNSPGHNCSVSFPQAYMTYAGKPIPGTGVFNKIAPLPPTSEDEEINEKVFSSSYIAVYRGVLESQGLLSLNESLEVEETRAAKHTDELFPDHTVASTTRSSARARAAASSKVQVESGNEPSHGKEEDDGLHGVDCASTEIHDAVNITKEVTIHTGSIETDHDPFNILVGEEHGVTILDMPRRERDSALNLTRLKVYSIDYHGERGVKVFTGNGQIRSTGDPKVIISTRVSGPVRLAVDRVHKRIYWVSDTEQTVEVADLDGQNRTVLLHKKIKITFPNNIAIDPHERSLFFVSNRSIYKTDLEGKNMTRIHLQGTLRRGVKCLAIDVSKKRLYFSGKVGNTGGVPYLASSNYDGQSVTDHLANGTWNDIYSIDVFHDTVYFVHYAGGELDTLWSLNLAKPTSPPHIEYVSPSYRGGIWSIKVYHPGVHDPAQDKEKL